MSWTPTQLKAAYQALSPTPASLADGAAVLNAQTTSVTADTDFFAVMGVLYARGSWRRVQKIAAGLLTPTTLPSGETAADIQAICQMLVDNAKPPANACKMSVSSVNAEVQADLGILQAAKLSDGKGVLWAAGEMPNSTNDPGDAAVLMAELVNLATPKWFPPVQVADLQTAGV